MALGLGLSLLTTTVAFAAADLNWSANTNISIGGHTYVILQNTTPEATTLTVGTSTITVVVPGASVFTLQSTDKYVLNNDKSIANNCSSSDNRLEIIGPKTVVITPAATECSPANNPVGGGGGGGGGGVPYPTPYPTPASYATPAYAYPTPASSQPGPFTASVKANATSGNGIKSLQQFLNANGFPIANSGPGSPGHETKTLGNLTKKALKNYQKAVGLKPTGKLDKATLDYLKAIGF